MANKKTYYDVIRKALEIYVNRENYCYFYGAKGQVMTEATMEALIKAEPAYFSRYSEKQIDAIKKYSLGKVGLDCSGFVNQCTGQVNYSTGYYMQTLNKTTPEKGTEGNLLYTTHNGQGRHVGIDIGYGYYIHFAREKETALLGRISDYGWETSGQLKNVDYTGAKN